MSVVELTPCVAVMLPVPPPAEAVKSVLTPCDGKIVPMLPVVSALVHVGQISTGTPAESKPVVVNCRREPVGRLIGLGLTPIVASAPGMRVSHRMLST